MRFRKLQHVLRKEIRVPVLGVVIIAVAIGALLLVGQFVPLFSNRDSSASNKDGLYISGTETIKVVAPDGKMVSTWTGPDPLSANAFNAIAGCVTGISNPGAGGVYGSCSGWITGMSIQTDTPGHTCNAGPDEETYCSFLTAPVSNTLTPVGCTTGSTTTYGSCTGWITEAIFGPTTFTAANCGSSCNVETVQAGYSSGGGVYGFDLICSADFNYAGFQPLPCLSGEIATVGPSDSLLVTIQFTVS